MDEKEKSNENDAWLATMLTLLSTSLLNNPIPKDTTLEKEVAYLHGKIDVLEKIVLEKCK